MEKYLNKYRNKTFQYLSNAQGFELQEFKVNSEVLWMCIKKRVDGNIAFIFMENSDDNIVMEAQKILKNQGRPYNLYVIYLSESNNIYNTQTDIYDGLVCKIVINPVNNSIVYADNNALDIAKLIISLNHENTRSNSNNLSACYVTFILIIINIIAYILSGIISGDFLSIDSKTLYILGAKVSNNIYRGEVWRLVTSMFLHGDIMHILCNMYSLFAVGSQIEIIYGRVRYLIIYFVSGICASILSTILSPNSLSVGASGAIFGLLGSFIVVAYINRKRISKGVIINLAFVVFINLYVGFSGTNIDNAAHIGGLISGVLVSCIIFFISKSKNKRVS